MALYFRLLAAGVRSRMQYKLDFIVSTVLYGFITLVDFLVVATVLLRYHHIQGWGIYEVAVLSGVASAAYGIYRIFGSELDNFERYLVSGEFDNLLIRPWPTLASLISRNFDLGRVGGLLQGLVVLGIGLHGVKAAPWMWAYAVLLLPPAGAAIIASCCLLAASAGFWITRIADLQTFTVNAPNAAAQYPMEIFPNWLRWLFTGLLPVACTAYIPMRYALGKGGGPLNLVVPFIAGAAALAVTYRLWLFGERHYQSTGS